MRIWSIHPKYLDAKGLVALWRETLLAKHVLEGRTNGYKNHPQLNRFKEKERPLDCINQYLTEVYFEAKNREYNFNKGKIDWKFESSTIKVTSGQMKFEIQHLLNKLKVRDIEKYYRLIKEQILEAHPIFDIVKGDIENWEIV